MICNYLYNKKESLKKVDKSKKCRKQLDISQEQNFSR